MPTLIDGALSKRHQKHLDRALALAENSPCKHRHGAVLVRGGRVLSFGWNKFRNDPQVHQGIDCSYHAEIVALRGVADATGATIYVARRNKQGQPRYSKPCTNCFSALLNAGVAKVVYT